MNDTGLRDRLKLTVITDPAAPLGAVASVESALAAGARTIQLRWKGARPRQLIELGRALRKLTAHYGALLIVNDRVDVALAIDAQGVHLGADDLPIAAARRITAPGFVIGTSTDNPDEAADAEAAGADYVAIGPIYPTGSKSDAGAVVGLEGLARARDRVRAPLVAIGGIDARRARGIIESGADGIAVIGAVMLAADPGEAVAELLRRIDGAGGGSA